MSDRKGAGESEGVGKGEESICGPGHGAPMGISLFRKGSEGELHSYVSLCSNELSH
jgi:hypothetical protein